MRDRPLWLRITYAVAGAIFIILGIISGFIPLIPGFVLVIIGVALLVHANPSIGIWLRNRSRKISDTMKMSRKKQEDKVH